MGSKERMDKWELIEITLDQLVVQWRANKESFDIDVDRGEIRLDDNTHSEMSISWSPAVLNDKSDDKPLSTDSMKLRKGVMITYDRKSEFKCLIYKVDKLSRRPAEGALAENSLSAHKCLAPIRSLHRKFMRLRSDILEYKRQKANSSYLSNLCGVFPGTLDEHILGSADGEEE